MTGKNNGRLDAMEKHLRQAIEAMIDKFFARFTPEEIGHLCDWLKALMENRAATPTFEQQAAIDRFEAAEGHEKVIKFFLGKD